MKKFAPVFIIIGVIVVGIVAFSVMRGTVSAPVAPEPVASTTQTGTATGTPAAPQVLPPGTPAPVTITNVIKVYTDPAWGFKLRYDPTWKFNKSGEVVTVSSPTADFMISPEQEIAHPARLESKETVRVIAGNSVTVTRYENPKESYAFYEYFTLRINKIEYYFKVLSTIDPNPDVEAFLGKIVLQ